MKKLVLLIILCFPFLSNACNLGFTPATQYYYIQQSNYGLDEDVKPSEDIEIDLNYMFDILMSDGDINETELEALLKYYEEELSSDTLLLETFFYQLYELPVVKKAADSLFPLIDFSQFDFNSKVITAEFSSKNVPSMRYDTDGKVWELSENTTYLPPDETGNKYTYENTGDNTNAGVNPITNVVYYKYQGYNPFFALDSLYNKALLSDGIERGMARFLFYRFQGKGGGIVNLDNMLVAVDTYTSLIFSFGVPTEFESILGQDSPTKWEPVEVAASAPNGQKYNFYEYDPAGYVDSDGKFVMYDWYTENLSQANASNPTKFYPRFTGVSPYLINFDVKKPTFSILSNQGTVSGEYYTELQGFAFDNPPGEVTSYDIYRIDDSSIERKLIKTISKTDTSFKDKTALILTKNPQYSIEAKDKDGKIIGSPSDLKEGSRSLTSREVLLAAIETIRHALIDNGAHGYITGSLTVNSENNGSFVYNKSGLFSATYTYAMSNYKPFFIDLTTTQNISYQSKNILPSIVTSTNLTGSVKVMLNNSDYGNVIFDNIKITNNDKNNPQWESGTLNFDSINYSANGDNAVPFGFYMSKDAYVTAILNGSDEYQQK